MDFPSRNSLTALGRDNAYLAALMHYNEVSERYARAINYLDEADRKGVNPSFVGLTRKNVSDVSRAAMARAYGARAVAIVGTVVAAVPFVMVPSFSGAVISIAAGAGAFGAGALSQFSKNKARNAEQELTNRGRRKFVDPFQAEICAELEMELDDASKSLSARIADLPPATNDRVETIQEIFHANPPPDLRGHDRGRNSLDDGGMGL